jgi:glycosyltransferase involved in cell wall biosynthesis
MRLALYHNLPSGGAKRALHETVRRLAAQHELTVYTLSTAAHDYCDLSPFVRAQHVSAFKPRRLYHSPWGRLNQLQRWRDLFRLQAIEYQMARAIDHAAYDVVYVQPSQWTQAPPLLQRLRTPSVYYLHEPPRRLYEADLPRPGHTARRLSALDRMDPLITLYRHALRRMDADSTRRATLRLANSEFTAAAVRRIYQCEAAVNYFGVDTDAFRPLTGVKKTGRVLSVGALRANKGFDFLIQALGQLPAAARPGLNLIGNADDPAERGYLERLARECQVALEIEVMVDQQRLVQRYCEAALFVYAPVREPLGLAPLEAMACGTPVVAVAEGGVPETVLDRQTGRLVDRDPSQFAAAVAELLADAPLRDQYGQQARAYVEQQWRWTRSVEQLTQHLERARAAKASLAA